MSTIHLIRLAIGLDRENMTSFIPGAKVIQGKLALNIAQFSGLPVSPSTLLNQITDVENAHLATKTSRGAIPVRRAKVEILWVSLSADCNFCEGICRQNPEQGPTLAAASGFRLISPGSHPKDLIKVTLELGKGIAHLQANVVQLPAPSGKKSIARTYLWRHTLDGGKTIVNDDPTPIGRTIITGLPLGVEVDFGVAVKDSTGVTPWSIWIPAFIH